MRHLYPLVTKLHLHVIISGFSPVRLWRLMTDRVQGNFITTVVELVDDLIVSVLMVDEESGTSRAAVGVQAVVEVTAVGVDVNNVDTIIESYEDELKREFF